MTRTISYSERNVNTDAPRIVAIPANTATIIFPDDRKGRDEICIRYLQNVGNNRLYLSFGLTADDGNPACDNMVNFHAYVEVGQLFDCSPDRGIVCGFSVGGTTVATTLKRRYDMSH